MELLALYKKYLLSKSRGASKNTAKNYVADVKRYIAWYESHFTSRFNVKRINDESISLYRAHLKKLNYSDVSRERFIASIKNFFNYLKTKGLITSSPFDNEILLSKQPKDSFLMHEFKVHLLGKKLSKVSIKNYLADLKQFTEWVESISGLDINKPGFKLELLKRLSPEVINEYKERLHSEAHLNPSSINRKLSSLRNYLSWMEKKDIVINNLPLSSHQPQKSYINESANIGFADQVRNNRNLHEDLDLNQDYAQPIFIRIIDKTVVIPLLFMLHKMKMAGKILNESEVFVKAKAVEAPRVNKVIRFNISQFIKRHHIRNLPKAMYAPFAISTKDWPAHKKLYFHIRYTRPKWYKAYHSYPISTYLHLGVLVIFTSIFGYSIYSSIYGDLNRQSPAFASPNPPPPRKLVFKGKLTDVNNYPITAETPLRFGIYNDQFATGSALLWQEVQNITPDSEGKFSAELGKYSELNSALFNDNPALFLGMTVGSEKELDPRQPLATISYSGNSQKLQGLAPITQSGAGTKNVVLALDSAGNLSIGGKASPVFQATGGKFTLSGNTILLNTGIGTNGNIEIEPDGSGVIDMKRPIQNSSEYNNIPSAIGAVEINDIFAVLATSSGQSAFTIDQNSTGPIISASTSGIAKFILENDGSGTFYGNLAVDGGRLTTSKSSFQLLNENVASLNIAGEAESITIGSSRGSTNINNTIIAKGGLTVSQNRSLIVSGNVASSLIPFANGLYDLGSKAFRWNNAYIDNIFTNPTATVSGFWQKSKGVISPLNSTDDLVIGGISTDSSRFQVIGAGAYAGTASTSGQLSFRNSSQVNLLNKGSLGFYNSYAGNAGISTAQPALFISPEGRIGIGLNNPAEKLDVNGSVRAQDVKLLSQGKLIFEDASAQIGMSNVAGQGSALQFYTRAVNGSLMEKMRLDANGSLVLGATTARGTLDINGNSGTAPFAVFSGNTTGAGLVIDNAGSGSILSASSSGQNRFVITQSGNVGIADANPENTLKVVGSVCVNSTAGACSGNTAGTIYAVNTTLQNADLAENYISSQLLEPGEIIMPEGGENSMAVVKTVKPYQSQTIGIISTKPGITLNSQAKTDDRYPYVYPVALSGRVPVKVNGERGPIRSGDFITSSSTPGTGMKATGRGVIVGKALENFEGLSAGDTGVITVFVSLSYNDPTTGYIREYNYADKDESGNLFFSGMLEAAADDFGIGILQVRNIVANSIKITGENLLIGSKTLREYTTELIADAMKNNEISKIIEENNENLNIDIISPLASEGAKPAIPSSQTVIIATSAAIPSASSSAEIEKSLSLSATESADINPATDSAALNASQSAMTDAYGSASARLNSQDFAASVSAETESASIVDIIGKSIEMDFDSVDIASIPASLLSGGFNDGVKRFPDGIYVYGDSVMSDLSLSGQLNVGGSMIIADNSINTYGSDLRLQDLAQGSLSIMGGLVRIDTRGNLNVGGDAVFAKDVRVKGKLAANIIAPLPDSDLVVQLKNKKVKANNNSNESQNFIIKNSSNSGVFAVNNLGDLIASGSGKFSKIAADAFKIVRGAQADTSLVETIASSSAGTAVITAYETERTIISPFVNTDSLIYVSAASETYGNSPYIARQTADSFTISINKPVSNEIKVNWWIIN